MKIAFAVLLCLALAFSFAGCQTAGDTPSAVSSSSNDTYRIQDSRVAWAFSAYPTPQEVYDKVKVALENYTFNTEGLVKQPTEDGARYVNQNEEVIYEIKEEGDLVIFHTVDSDKNAIIIKHGTDAEGQTRESVIGSNYIITNRREIIIYGKEREMIYYVLEDGIWQMSEATYYDDGGMETYFFGENRLFAAKSEHETVTLDKVLTDSGIIAVEFEIGRHKFTEVEEGEKHILFLTADMYAVFDDEQKAADFAAAHNGTTEAWKYGYYTVIFENATLRLDENCDNLDYNTPTDGSTYFRTAVLNEKGEIVDFTFDGPVLAK